MSMEPIVAVEIGTSRARVFVGEAREDGALMITAVGDCASSGMRKGELFHFESASQCLERALRQAEDAANLTVNEVHVALSGSQIEGLPNRGEIPVDGEITAEHVEHVCRVAREVTLPADREILHSIVGQFSVDGLCGVKPEGMVGQKLAADVLIVHGQHARMFNLVRVVKGLKLEVADLLFSGLCAAMSALSGEQKLQGVLLIDLGGGTTDYMVYAQAKIADAGAIGVGGDHVTNDIAKAFRLSTMEAEALKIQHGDAMVSAAGRTRRLPLPAAAGETPRTAKLSDLQSVIHLRMEETFGLIRARLQRQNLLHLLGGVPEECGPAGGESVRAAVRDRRAAQCQRPDGEPVGAGIRDGGGGGAVRLQERLSAAGAVPERLAAAGALVWAGVSGERRAGR